MVSVVIIALKLEGRQNVKIYALEKGSLVYTE
jgi:hypothetical protein